ncbi:hypothetical protein FRB96_009194 [Tulasnella sp. 330]|nr:hypothetical protein FRB96_009194 [Tulasnella sp. 330]
MSNDPEKSNVTNNSPQLDELNIEGASNGGGTPVKNGASEINPHPCKQEKIFLAANRRCMLLIGWDCGSLGPLLPTVQKHYHVDYTIVSMIFVAICCGTIPASVAAGYLTDRIGYGKLVALGAVIQLGTYSGLAAAPTFPAFCVIYMLNGAAATLQISAANIFVTGLPNLETRPTNLGIMHAVFGSGALIAPLVATQFAQMRHWSFHYLTSLGLAIINNIVLTVVFKWKRQEVLVPEMAIRRVTHTKMAPASDYYNGGAKLLRLLRLSTVHYMAIFTLIYVGIEFTIGFEFTVWFVPNLIENAVAVSIIGFFLGPNYPVMLNVAGRKLPQELLAGSIGWISAIGNIGTAVFPFATGALASKYTVAVLHPLLVAMFSALLMMWLLAMASKVPDSA